MILMDYVAAGVIVLFGAIGAFVGFGRGVKVLSKGLVGIVTTVAVCYSLSGFVFDIGFVRAFTEWMRSSLVSSEIGLLKTLANVRIEKIAVFAIMFLAVFSVKTAIAGFLVGISRIDCAIIRVTDRTLGAALGLAFALVLALAALSVVYMVSGAEGGAVFEGSFLKIDVLYKNNPIVSFLN